MLRHKNTQWFGLQYINFLKEALGFVTEPPT